jgi:hypothetical protein
MDRLPNLASAGTNVRTAEEMRELLSLLMKGGKLQFALKRGIPLGTVYGIVNWYYLTRTYRIASI